MQATLCVIHTCNTVALGYCLVRFGSLREPEGNKVGRDVCYLSATKVVLLINKVEIRLFEIALQNNRRVAFFHV